MKTEPNSQLTPYNITTQSNVSVIRIKEVITEDELF